MLGRVSLRRTPLAVLALSFALASLTGRAALAAPPADCPPGSVGKEEGGFQWCEPTVCLTDADCMGGKSVCRSMPLCVEVGTVADAAAGSKRLVVASPCVKKGAAYECPAQTTCLEGKRCIEKTKADQMGILVEDAGLPAEPPKKSVCGCSVPGVATSDAAWMAPLGVIAVALVRRRRRNPGLGTPD